MFLIYSDGHCGAVAAIVGLVHTIRVPYQQHQHNLSYSEVTFSSVCNFGARVDPDMVKNDPAAS